MKITGVEIWDVKADWWPAWNPVIIRVNTDEGISGLGEVGLAFGVGHAAGAGYVKNVAESMLIGADPMNVEKIWESMFRNTFWALGGGPVVYGAMSAVDIACWDIRGKALKAPCYQLLGGKTNDSLRAYASQLQFGWSPTPTTPAVKPADYAKEALKAALQGYNAVKVNPLMFDENGKRGWNNLKILPYDRLKFICERVKAIRDAIGPEIDIILETHAMLTATTAIQLGRALEDNNIMFYEEPVNAVNPEVMAKVSENIPIPLAGGERLYTRWGFRPYIERQILSIVQPDLCLVGGLSEAKKISDYANLYDINVQGHVCGSPVSVAAALHLETAIPNFIIHEHISQSTCPGNCALVEQDMQPKNSYITVSDEPGLGITLNEKYINKYAEAVVVK